MKSQIDRGRACLFSPIGSIAGVLLFFPGFFGTAPLRAWQDRQPPPAVPAGSALTSVPNAATESKTTETFPVTELPPLKRLVLYNSGVGQWQHEGLVEGNARLEIRFGSQDVDNVLKSLVFWDSGGGSARAVEYKPAPDPEDVAAGTIGAPMTLAQLLQRFRGETASLIRGGSRIEGTIYGVENRTEGDQVVETVVLINEQGLQSMALSSIDRVQFDKEELRTELAQAMAGLVKSRKANQKKLDLLLEGSGQRQVAFAYVVDMPIWRMTYRAAIKDGSVQLQGWAHVDNVTGVDWQDVTMELRSGRPQAFHVNVFAPLVSSRPSLGNSVFDFASGVVLVTQWFGYEAENGWGGGGFGFGGGFGGGRFGGDPGGSPPSAGIDIESAFRESAEAGSTSQMVRYLIDKPVNLAAGRSAALPVFGYEFPARVLTVCVDEEAGLPPMHALEFSNTTGLAMVSGPLSVMRDGDFVGDGQLTRLAVDQRAEIVYGFDRAVRLSRKDKTTESRQESLSIHEGVITVSGRSIERRVYTIENDDSEPRDVILYCPGSENPKVRISPEPGRKEGGRLRFEVAVDARSSREQEVVFETEVPESMPLADVDKGDVDRWLNLGVDIAAPDQEFFARLFAMDNNIRDISGKKADLELRRTNLLSEQSRMRENVQALEGNPEAAQSFVDKLLKMEAEIEALAILQANVGERLKAALEERVLTARSYGKQAGGAE
jgi:hypothetical protein